MRGATRCYIGASTPWYAAVTYRVAMADPAVFEDPGPPDPQPPSRGRRALTVALLVTLIVSIVVLAFVSGRGVINVAPVVPPPVSVIAASPNTSRLAIVDSSGRLMTSDASGGSVVPYGAAGIAFTFPAWSPDGSRLAVIGQGVEGSGVYVFTVRDAGAAGIDPAIVYRSTDRPPFYLYWAPDSRRVTFLTTEPDGIALRLAPADGSAPSAVIRTGAPMYWAWVDRDRLLIHSGGAGPDGFLGELGVDGISVEPDVIVPGGFRAPAVTSDGRSRAFVTPGDGTPAQVVVEARDRSNPHALDVFGAAALDFGPGTDEVAFVAPAVAGRDTAVPIGPLRLMKAGTGEVRTLLAGAVVAFFWAPDGRTIAALEIPGTGDGQVASTVDARLAASAGASPTPHPGVALRLLFVGVDSGSIRSQRAVRVSATFVEQVIPFFDQYALSHRVWSADGTAVVLPVVADDGSDRLETVPADGSEARPVGDGVIGFWSP